MLLCSGPKSLRRDGLIRQQGERCGVVKQCVMRYGGGRSGSMEVLPVWWFRPRCLCVPGNERGKEASAPASSLAVSERWQLPQCCCGEPWTGVMSQCHMLVDTAFRVFAKHAPRLVLQGVKKVSLDMTYLSGEGGRVQGNRHCTPPAQCGASYHRPCECDCSEASWFEYYRHG
ncbi:hypothetical protein GWK47_040566 [Chionoecetes opilio]|uniref:Uncharacterized protein n=1 Tax=Chionoecetes opilio TaxID=41210 RepID=A0A8J5CZU5_CHIOP|nr:hypothetical protein GWK47_040566 [Chionoecetes opilio]